VELRLFLPLKSKSFSHLKAILMSRNAAPHVDKQEKNDRVAALSREAAQAISHNAKCTLLPVRAVGKLPKCRSNPEKADRYIAGIATAL